MTNFLDFFLCWGGNFFIQSFDDFNEILRVLIFFERILH